MELQESKQIISDSKNIYLITSEEPEAMTSTLALFYTLKELGKNVNLVLDSLPEKLKFLLPDLDSVSYPKNFVISIPNNVATISQIHYEKSDDALKIFLTLENGSIKKDNMSFYFLETKPDLIITVGIKDYAQELSTRLNSFGFLLDSPILNIDSSTDTVQTNKKFGKINLLQNSSITEIALALSKELKEGQINKPTSECLLSGLILYTENFQDKVTGEIFQLASNLVKTGADIKNILANINKKV